MKTPIQIIMDAIEMETNNGVEISQKVLYGMLKNSLPLERQAIENAVNYQKLNYVGDKVRFIKDGRQYFQDVYGTIEQQELPF